MNPIKQQPFPSWLVRAKCNRISNLYKNLRVNHPPLIRRNKVYRWSHTYNRCRNKLSYRFERYISHIDKLQCPWKLCITEQLQKVNRRYDPVYLWSICEYENCEKVNKADFHPERHESLLWQFKTIEQSVDISKRMNSISTNQTRSKSDDWELIIGKSRIRFSKVQIQHNNMIDDNNWLYCYRANKEKVRKWDYYFSWSSRIIQNQRKIQCLA